MSDRLNAEVQALKAALADDPERLDDVLRIMKPDELAKFRRSLGTLREAIEVALGWRPVPTDDNPAPRF